MARRQSNLTSKLLEAARREHAAWKLLEAVRELFPLKFAELEDLRGVYDTFEREEEEELDYQVWCWTKDKRIACDAVNKAAYEFAEGRNVPVPATLVLSTDTINLFAPPPRDRISDSIKVKERLAAIEANPLDETLKEFLTRATDHYHRKREFLKQWGYERIHKREYDHFRYLAVHRVGGYTWAEIAEGRAFVEGAGGKLQPLKFPSRDLKTIAGEAAKIAKLLGMAPGKRGRRPGRRDTTPGRHVGRQRGRIVSS